MEVTLKGPAPGVSNRKPSRYGQATCLLEMRQDGLAVPAYFSFADRSLLAQAAKSAGSFLHPNERRGLESLNLSYRKDSYLLGRFAVKMALSAYLDEPRQSKIEIVAGIFNQPLVKYPAMDLPEITMSHSLKFAAAIAYQAGHVMGIDVEDVEPSKFGIYKRSLTLGEQRIAEGFGVDSEGAMAILMGTAKDALSKAIRCEPPMPSDLLEISAMLPDGRDRFEAVFRNFAHYRGCSWLLPQAALSMVRPKRTTLHLEFGE